jgi:hypothetical protein
VSLGALYNNSREAAPLRITLEELGFPQPPTPIQVDNTTAAGLANGTVKPRRSKAMTMRYFWIQDRVSLGQYLVYWDRGVLNLQITKERISASGEGSKLGHETLTSLRILKETIQKYNISTMIDMPCGDVNWIFDSRATDSLQLYLGLDITEKVIAMNQIRFAHHSNKMFRHWDGVSCPLPKYQLFSPDDSSTSLAPFELVHSRDVVQHLPLAAGLQFFCTIFQSGAKVLVTTTYIGRKNRNIDIGRFYHNNLSLEPFNFPKDGVTCELTHPQHEGDSTCVYDLTQPWVQEYIRKKMHRQFFF